MEDFQYEAPLGGKIPGEDLPDEWALVEVFGHRQHWGRIREVEKFGTKLLAIDVPKTDAPDAPFRTHLYGGGAIFSVTPTDEATARKKNKPWAPSYVELPSADGDDEGENL